MTTYPNYMPNAHPTNFLHNILCSLKYYQYNWKDRFDPIVLESHTYPFTYVKHFYWYFVGHLQGTIFSSISPLPKVGALQKAKGLVLPIPMRIPFLKCPTSFFVLSPQSMWCIIGKNNNKIQLGCFTLGNTLGARHSWTKCPHLWGPGVILLGISHSLSITLHGKK
jgi:hypothetical protein